MGTRPDFDEWVAARGHSLLVLAYLLTGDRDEAEDVVQDALSRSLSRWSRISGRQDPDAYVHRRVVNASASRRRRSRHRETPVPTRSGGVVMTGIPTEDHGLVWDALAAVSVDQRTALVLRYHLDHDVAEIADLTGAREGSVRSRVSRGLAALGVDLGAAATEIETQLCDSLADLADAAGRAQESTRLAGLAVGARARLRHRRTTIAKVMAGAAVVAVAPFGIAQVGGDGSGPPPAPHIPDAHFIVRDLAPHPSERDDGMDEVTWRGIRFLVPPQWRLGVPTAWCAEDKDPAAVVPRIALPGRVRSKTSCTPTSGYGVTVSAAAALAPPEDSRYVFKYEAGDVDTRPAFPDGTWVSYWYDDRWVVTIATPDPGLTSRMAMSVRADEDGDACSVFTGEMATRGSLVQPVSVSPCGPA